MIARLPASFTTLAHAATHQYLVGSLSPTSRKHYAAVARLYAHFAVETHADPLAAPTLVAYRDWLVTTTTLSPHTINTRLSGVRAIIGEGVERGVVDDATGVAFARVKAVSARALRHRTALRNRHVLSGEDLLALCRIPDIRTPLGQRDEAVLLTLISTGARLEEVRVLRRHDITRRDGGHWGVQVLAKGKETRATRPIAGAAVQSIDAWLAVRAVASPYIFTAKHGRGDRWGTTPMSATALWAIVRRMAEAAGMTGVTPHALRRYTITKLIATHGVDAAQRVAGHASARTTLDYYNEATTQLGITDDLVAAFLNTGAD